MAIQTFEEEVYGTRITFNNKSINERNYLAYLKSLNEADFKKLFQKRDVNNVKGYGVNFNLVSGINGKWDIVEIKE